MLRFDEGDQAFGLLVVIRPAGVLQFLSVGGEPMDTERGARGFEGVGQSAYGVVVLLL